MTLDDLGDQLRALGPGKAMGIPYQIYADLWPPGEPDQQSRGACHRFARDLGCRIENKPADRTVWIIKDT